MIEKEVLKQIPNDYLYLYAQATGEISDEAIPFGLEFIKRFNVPMFCRYPTDPILALEDIYRNAYSIENAMFKNSQKNMLTLLKSTSEDDRFRLSILLTVFPHKKKDRITDDERTKIENILKPYPEYDVARIVGRYIADGTYQEEDIQKLKINLEKITSFQMREYAEEILKDYRQKKSPSD